MSNQTVEKQNAMMSEGYWRLWNRDVQQQIDENIEKHRKADASIALANAPAGTEVKVEQLSHEFVFGAHIFNYDQLGSDERNERYKKLYGTLFNSATISFYWKLFEMEEGKPRFRAEYRDTAEFWNRCKEPKLQPHWRRPASDPVVDFCLKKGIRLLGHPLVWGSHTWQIPDWLINRVPFEFLKKANLERDANGRLSGSATLPAFGDMTADEFADANPAYATLINTLMAKRIMEIALHYGDKIDSWDVVNESATDFERERMVPGARICKSVYGIMPGDYTYRGFKIADSLFPPQVQFNINDYHLQQCYVDQIEDLRRRGCRIDTVGAQMHLFNPQICLDIADGKSDAQSPAKVLETMARISRPGLPIHLSEITITAPHNDQRGQAIQAVITRNLYRLWFSIKPMMGITWWNVVDDCGAPGEPSVSGLFSRDMKPKPAYHTLHNLINREWKTKTTVKVDRKGEIAFRGFRGNYRISWRDSGGKKQSQTCCVK